MKLQTILFINNEIQQSKTFGGLYKTTKYSTQLIQLITTIDFNDISDILLSNEEATIDDIEDLDLKAKLINIKNLIIKSEEEYNDSLEGVNYLTQYYEVNKVKDIYEVNFQPLDALDFPKVVIGKMFNIYSLDKMLLGKAMLSTLNRNTKIGTFKVFNELLIDKALARIDTWWQYSSNITEWLDTSLNVLISTNDTSATMKVTYPTLVQRLGRVGWILKYKASLEQEYEAIAQGVDSILPGLLIISKKDYLFAGGYYKLSIIDKSINITTPIKKYLEWYKDYPCSELLNDGIELRNG